MQNVALYPFNKITQGIIRFRDLTDFSVKVVIDFVLHQDSDAGQLIEDRMANIPVTNNIEAALSSVDTLILNDPGTSFGNNESVYGQYNLKELWKLLVLTAHDKGVRIISVHEIFDQETLQWLQENKISIDIEEQIPDSLQHLLAEEYTFPSSADEVSTYLNYFDLDYKITKYNQKICKVGIFATRGCLGKFTAQMSLFRELQNTGERVKAIITEPTASLFHQPGADIMKFLARRSLNQYPYYIHAAVQEAENQGYDFVLLSGQGSLLPNENFVIAATKISYLRAYNPDVTVLIAGYDDDEQIKDCLDLLRIYGNVSQTFAILIPDKFEVDFGQYLMKSAEEMEERKAYLKGKFAVDYVECVLDINKLTDHLIDRKLTVRS